MRFWTAHIAQWPKPTRAPVLLREGFSLWAMLFGPLWLLAWRAWIPAVLVFCAEVALGLLTAGSVRVVASWGLAWLIGLSGRDMVRWSLARRGYTLAHVVAARNADAALARLIETRPDLAGAIAGGRFAAPAREAAA